MARGGVEVEAYPALVDVGDGVEMRHLESRPAAERATRAGVLRLLMLALRRELKAIARELPGIETACLAYALVLDGDWVAPPPPGAPARGSCAELRAHLLERAVERAFVDGEEIPRSDVAFRAMLERGHPAVAPSAMLP